MKKLFVAVALASTAIAGAAFAGEMGKAGHGAAMMRADANKDGTITRAEFLAKADARFAKIDANGDGQISADEMKSQMNKHGMKHDAGAMGGMGEMREKMHARMLQRVDTNKDGKISRDEMHAQATARFDRLDANRDGKIDKDEMAAMRAKGREHADH